MNTIIKQKSAFFISHNGLGDNISNISAVLFLLQYYNTINFFCKKIHCENLTLLFQNKINSKNIILVPLYTQDENTEFVKILNTNNNNLPDIFISGGYKRHFKSRITHPDLLKYNQNDNEFSTVNGHIREFYYDIGLDLSIYYNYFNIESTDLSTEYYKNIKNYNIIFLHTKSSNKEINLSNIIDKYINDDDKIIICANKNIYNINHNKYELANKFINLLVAYYIDIILNSLEIHVIDSAFSCIIYPLNMTNKLSAKIIEVYSR
jgi:hypothetical protein